MLPNISVIIPVHNAEDHLLLCLSSLSETSPLPDEIIVAADGCTDRSAARAEQSGVKVLSLPERKGPAHARNAGAHFARGEILFFLDADVTIPPETFARIGAAFQQDPSLAALFGSYDDDPDDDHFLSQYKNLFHHYVHQTSKEEASTFWSGCGAIRRHIFLDVGGFDESYGRPSIEDIELGHRLKRVGHRIRLLKQLQVKHLKRWSILGLIKSDFFDRALPWTDLILGNRGLINDLNLRFSSRLSVILIYAFLSALFVGFWWSGSFFAAGALALLLMILNLPVSQFFLRKRGFWFMIRTVPLQWFYYFYGGLAFAVGCSRFLFSRQKSSKARLSIPPTGRPDPVQSPEDP
jgi:glycosyltransferase involved in cell wall biosynthesis